VLFFGLLLTPVFYVLVRRLSERTPKKVIEVPPAPLASPENS
jgi:hypothetical protein